MKKNISTCTLLIALLCQSPVWAGEPADPWQMKLRAGYNIGGTAPLGMPATIRSIDKFSLTPSFMVGADVMMPLKNNLGLLAGLRLENKALDVEATTKKYHMEVKKGESMLEGMYYGHVRQQVTEWMLTVPVQAAYRLGSRVMLKGGPYLSVLLSKDFSGYVYDGYLRQGTPTGPKVTMGVEENERATYDFSNDMRTLQAGIAVGADITLSHRLGLSADLNWGLNGIFKSHFKTVEQTLYPIYGTIGVFYQIK